jgi:hypothetical protein
MPAKRVNTGDGFFFALVIALGIWFAGLIFTLIYSKGATSDFEPIAAIGGVLWATGNMCVWIHLRETILHRSFYVDVISCCARSATDSHSLYIHGFCTTTCSFRVVSTVLPHVRCVIPIMQTIGLSLGLLMWGSVALVCTSLISYICVS